MGKKSPDDKLQSKRAIWLSRTVDALGVDGATALELLRMGRHQSIRLNPLVADPQQTVAELQELGWRGRAFELNGERVENCYSVDEGMAAIRDSQQAANGAVLIQNAASWLPVLALDPQPGDTILDVCAAPGGKTTHIAALTNNQAQITANDNSRARLMKLQAMCQRMSADIEQYTLYDALYLARKLDGQMFDRIMIDAPCSGEGMMDYDRDKDFESWSVAHIKRLQQLQKRVLVQAWQLLKPGGTLVYSTCTMAPEEDEAVIDYGLRTLEGVSIVDLDWQLPNRLPAVTIWNGRQYNPDIKASVRLKPSKDIEAFYVCKLIKSLQQAD